MTKEPKGPDYHLKDARNIVWAVAFVALLPCLLIVYMAFSDSGMMVEWDAVTLGILGYSVLISGLAVVGGIKLGQGKKSGFYLALIPCAMALLSFPIGTILGIAALVKLTKKEFISAINQEDDGESGIEADKE